MAGARLRYSALTFQRARLSTVLHRRSSHSQPGRLRSKPIPGFPCFRPSSLFLKAQKYRHGGPLTASVTSNPDLDTVADKLHGTAAVTLTPEEKEDESSQIADDALSSRHTFTGDELHFVDATDGWRLALWRYLPSRTVCDWTPLSLASQHACLIPQVYLE